MLSIIIITKNEEKCLPRLLDSIKEQTFKDYEIIVSDANSIDRTKKIAKSFGCKIVDGGLPGIGRNNGAKVAKGDILLFLDADVVLPARFLELNLKEFKRRKLGCATTIYKPLSKKLIDKIFYRLYNNWAITVQHFSPHAAGVCIFVRKNLFKRLNGFNEKLQNFCEDHNFVNRCGKKEKFRILWSIPLLCDVRRLEKEGRIKLFFKYIYAGSYRIFWGDSEVPVVDYELNGNVLLKRGQKLYT